MCRDRSFALFLVLTVALTGCGEPSYVVTRVELERAGWEEVTAFAHFGRQTLFGDADAVEPDTTYAYLFDSDYDTLFAGAPGRIPVPDVHLGSREALLVEVCGGIDGQSMCLQRGFSASPKRIDVVPEIEYPHEQDTGQARYRVEVTVERQRFESTSWERVDVSSLDLFARAYVKGHETSTVEVPLAVGEGELQLRGRDGYDDFAFALNSGLYDAREVDVCFDLFAGLNGRAEQVEQLVRTVREKQTSERRSDVAELARLAARHLVAHLANGHRPLASVYVDDWRFNTITDRYAVTLELVWEDDGTFFNRRRRIEGTLAAHASGRDATFELSGGSRRGRERWKERVGGTELSLPRLRAPDESAAQGPDPAPETGERPRRRGRRGRR